MIQRIQSIYLILASAAMALLQKFAYFSISADEFFVNEDSLTMIFSLVPVAGLLAAIFFFKNRPLQLRITRISLFFVAAFIGYALYQAFTGGFSGITFEIGTVLPILALVLGWLALGRIRADEKLVESSRSRLR
ncbi:MAG: DUF4293 domain-containing protein [Saprospiraceae bacterium]|nr:DUF4293 domain-containing protein [Saprospiraceae bacterium]